MAHCVVVAVTYCLSYSMLAHWFPVRELWTICSCFEVKSQ